jgi:hypothetical protein
MANNRYVVGNIVQVDALFKDANDALIDPSAVLAWTKNKATKTERQYTYGQSSELTRNSIGSYSLRVDLTETGEWVCRIYSTGSMQASNGLRFTVEEF